MRTAIILLLLFLDFPTSALSQELPKDLSAQKDSLVSLIENYKGGSDSLHVMRHFEIATLYNRHLFDSATVWLKRAKATGLFTYWSEINYRKIMGAIHLEKGNYEAAAKEFKAGLDKSKESGYEPDEALFLMRIGFLSRLLTPNESGKSLRYYKKAEELLNQIGDERPKRDRDLRDNFLGDLYLDRGGILLGLEEYESALSDLQKGARIAEKLNNTNARAASYYYQGHIKLRMHEYEDAYQMFLKADSLDQSMGNLAGGARMQIGEVLYTLGRLNEAVRHYEKFHADIQGLGHTATEVNLKVKMAKLYAEKRDFQKAYAYSNDAHESGTQYRQEFFNKEQAKLEKDFDLRLKDEQNKTLEQEKKVAEGQADRERIMKFSAFTALAVLIFISMFIVRSNRQRRKKNIHLEEQNVRILQQKEEINSQAEELRSANESLKNLDDFKQRMMSMIMHDFKNPLNEIINQNQIPAIRSSGLRLMNMTHNFLDVHRFQSAELKISKASEEVRPLLQKAASHLKYMVSEKNIDLELSCNEGILTALDSEIFIRIPENLLSNALKFTPVSGKILVSAEVKNERLILSVEDNGPGVPEEKRDLIFNDFYQAEAKNFGVSGSSGLGLAFCKMAVEAHGGSIKVKKSNTLGGAAFILSFPDAQQMTYTERQTEAPEKDLSFIFSEEDLKTLYPLAKELRNQDLFMTSEILAKVDIAIDPESEQQQKWRAEFEERLLIGDEQGCRALIDKIMS